MKPTILTCAVTGTFPTRAHNPNLPVTPEEIANACIGAAKAGAAICHIHVREPSTGAPSMKLEYYPEVVKRIRRSDTDLVINLTAGPGGRFMPSDDEPAKAGPGTMLTTPEIRTAACRRAEAGNLHPRPQHPVVRRRRRHQLAAQHQDHGRAHVRGGLQAGAGDLQHRRHDARPRPDRRRHAQEPGCCSRSSPASSTACPPPPKP